MMNKECIIAAPSRTGTLNAHAQCLAHASRAAIYMYHAENGEYFYNAGGAHSDFDAF